MTVCVMFCMHNDMGIDEVKSQQEATYTELFSEVRCWS